MRNDGSRDAYVHTRLQGDRDQSATCTEVLTALGIGHNARLQFHVVAPDTVRLDQIIRHGELRDRRRTWEAGRNQPRGASSSARSQTLTAEALPAHQRSSFPFGNCAEIHRLADSYWNLITPTEAAEEHRFEQDFDDARKHGFVSKELFVRVGRWKSVRQTPNYESNSPKAVRVASAEAFATSDDATALSALMRLRGVGLRTASAILQWMRPAQFPILDVRVVSALGWAQPTSWADLGFYARVAQRVRGLARDCAVDLRTMDRALWAWDKRRSLGQA
jgi:hypothetical protein